MTPQNRAQQEALDHIAESHRTRPVTPSDFKDVSQEGALRRLLRSGPNYLSSAGQLAPFCEGMVFLPDDQSEPVDLGSILDGAPRDYLEKWEHDMMLSNEEQAALVEQDGIPDYYFDPVLDTDSDKYAGLLRSMRQASLIDFTRSPGVSMGSSVF